MATETKHTNKRKYLGIALVCIIIVILGCIGYNRYESRLEEETSAANSEASAGRASFFHQWNPFSAHTNNQVSQPNQTTNQTNSQTSSQTNQTHTVAATKPVHTTTTTSTTTSTTNNTAPSVPSTSTPTTTTVAVTTSLPSLPIVPTPVATATTTTGLQWGAYVGDGTNDLSAFETLVGKPVNILATFEGWQDTFPLNYKQSIGAAGKTLLVYWEPNFGYSQIVNGSKDAYITQFAADAKSYGYPVILVPFDEMNLNEEDWGYGANGNTAANFIVAWQHIHNLFAQATNVKFGIAYNNVSIPNIAGNQFSDYYPGSSYVDYVGVDGFNFENPSVSFSDTFTSAINTLRSYGKPLYIFSSGSAEAPDKAAWITQGLGSDVKTYANIAGWIWFNKNDGGNQNWLVNSDPAALAAFKAVLP